MWSVLLCGVSSNDQKEKSLQEVFSHSAGGAYNTVKDTVVFGGYLSSCAALHLIELVVTWWKRGRRGTDPGAAGQPRRTMPQSDVVALRLQDIKSKEGNNACVDCGDKATCHWASIGFGVLCCLQCAGAHRGLGVHISFVQSISMDDWSGKEHHMSAPLRQPCSRVLE